MKNKNIWMGVILVVLIIFVLAVSKLPRNSSSNQPIKIGVVIPLTGIAANYGEHQKNAIELAREEINSNGGILGKPLEVIYEDDATDPKKSVAAVQKLISLDNIQVIIGGTWDLMASAVMPIIDENKITLISASVAPDMLQLTSPYFFSTYSNVASNQAVIEQFLSRINDPRVVIIYPNNYWGMAHGNTFKKVIQNTGSTLIKEIVLPNFDNNDIQREISLIKSLNFNTIITAINYNDAIEFAKKRKVFDVNVPVLGHRNLANAFYDGKLSDEIMKDIYVFRPAQPQKNFTNKYIKKFNKQPLAEADSAYDAVYAIKYAIEGENKNDKASIFTGLRKISFDGASGKIDFADQNYPIHKMPILQVFSGGDFINI